MTSLSQHGRAAGTQWDPQLYLKFSDHRLRPALELLDRVPLASPQVVYDLGCGAGNVTRLIAERWPEAQVYGVDNSREMLAQASREPGPAGWIEADIRDWMPERQPDLIFTNATLQWVEGHARLFPRLAAFLPSGGCLAVQMPLSWSMPSHRLMRETLEGSGPDGAPLGTDAARHAAGRKWVSEPEEYYDLLIDRSSSLDIWATEYWQVLRGPDPVLEWVSGTGLRPILDGLAASQRQAYLAEYSRRLRDAYPRRADGTTLYPFRRLFIVATIR